jgi:hypothetical protein
MAPLLFLVFLCGRTARSLIELHDVRFVAGVTIEDTIPQLRRQWFGLRRGLHIDSYVAVRRLEAWRVELRPQPAAAAERLWFVNMGAYDPGRLAELHDFGLFVAPTAQAARSQARRRLLAGALQQHRDDLRAVDDCLAVDQVDGLHVHLLPLEGAAATGWQPLRPDWFGYRRIDGPAAAGPGAAD